MENDKVIAVLNENIVHNLENLAYSIKYYVNVNVDLANDLIEDGKTPRLMDNDDINELLEIRTALKKLANKLDAKLCAR